MTFLLKFSQKWLGKRLALTPFSSRCAILPAYLGSHRGQIVNVLLLAVVLCGCATRHPLPSNRRFDFAHDTFSFANELKWEYRFDTNGNWNASRREVPPDYSQHCFVVARGAKQFFNYAQFDPALPKTTPETYRRLIRKIATAEPRRVPAQKIVIPGYANLRDFSEDHERLFKEECGGAWQSYFQRGNWRMVFPFSRDHQERTAGELAEKLKNGGVAVVHAVTFPKLALNHAVAVFDVKSSDGSIEFTAYDPNFPEAPIRIDYDRTAKRFRFPRSNYFIGGEVNIYEIFVSPLL
jgi:hypothetical protein